MGCYSKDVSISTIPGDFLVLRVRNVDGKLDILLLPMSITTPPFRRIREQAKLYKYISKTADTHSDSECHKKKKRVKMNTFEHYIPLTSLGQYIFLFFYIGYVYLVKYKKYSTIVKYYYNLKILYISNVTYSCDGKVEFSVGL